MAKQVVRVEPSAEGVGQTLFFEDGTSSYDPYNSYSAQPSSDPSNPSAPAVPAPQPTFTPNNPLAVRQPDGPPAPPAQPTQVISPQEASASPELRAQEASYRLNSPAQIQGNPTAPTDLQKGFQPTTPTGQNATGGSLIDVSQHFPDYSGSMQVEIPGQPGHWQPASSSRTGVAPAAAREIRGTANEMTEQSRQLGEAQYNAQDQLVKHYEQRALHMYAQAQADDLAYQANAKRNQLVQQNIQSRIDDALKFKPNRHELFEGTSGGIALMGAALGMIAGGALEGLTLGRAKNDVPDLVFKMVDENVKQQIAHNSTIYQELVRRLGDEQAAAGILRAQHLQAVSDMTKAMDMGTHAQEVRASMAGIRERAALDMAQTKLKVQMALAPQEATHMAYIAPTPAQLLTVGRSQMALQAMGISPDQYQKFNQSKLYKEMTVNEGVQQLKELSDMRNFLGTLKAANGGTLPGFDDNLNWEKNGMLRNMAAKWNLGNARKAGELYRRMNALRFELARSAGRVTEPELEISQDIIGKNSGELENYLEDTYNHYNGLIRGRAEADFPGRGQNVLNIFQGAVGGMPGVEMSQGRAR